MNSPLSQCPAGLAFDGTRLVSLTTEPLRTLADLRRKAIEHLAWERFAAGWKAGYQQAQQQASLLDKKSQYYTNLVNHAAYREAQELQTAFSQVRSQCVALVEVEAARHQVRHLFLGQLGLA